MEEKEKKKIVMVLVPYKSIKYFIIIFIFILFYFIYCKIWDPLIKMA